MVAHNKPDTSGEYSEVPSSRGWVLCRSARFFGILVDRSVFAASSPGNMKTDTKNQNETKTQATLAELNAKIVELQQRRVALAQPLKDRYAELRTELMDTERHIRELDETWKAEPLKPRAEAKITEILQAKRRAMTEAEIMAAVGNLFTKYKIKKTLEKRFSVDADGKYSEKA
jgi:hypothetical protein